MVTLLLQPASAPDGTAESNTDTAAATSASVSMSRPRAVFTNTMPTQAYRSSGRPEVTYAIERLIDTAAARLGIDRIELRRSPDEARHRAYDEPFRRYEALKTLPPV